MKNILRVPDDAASAHKIPTNDETEEGSILERVRVQARLATAADGRRGEASPPDDPDKGIFGLSVTGLLAWLLVFTFCVIAVYKVAMKDNTPIDPGVDKLTLMALMFYLGRGSMKK